MLTPMDKPGNGPRIAPKADAQKLRQLGTVMILLGLVGAVCAPITVGWVLPVWILDPIALITLVGVGLRIEAAIRDARR